MMQWDAPTIAQLGRDAGFFSTDLHTLVAIALAASRGHDHYHLEIFGGLGGDRRGLYGIDLRDNPEARGLDLYNPVTSTETAYALTRARSGFGWSAEWRTGATVPLMHYAATESSRVGYAQRARTSQPVLANRKAHEQWPTITRY